jgi:hypothetical protein
MALLLVIGLAALSMWRGWRMAAVGTFLVLCGLVGGATFPSLGHAAVSLVQNVAAATGTAAHAFADANR